MAKKEAPEDGAQTGEEGGKKKKDKKEGGSISTPVLIGIIVGSQIMLAVIVIFSLKFVFPSGGNANDTTHTKELTESEMKEMEKAKEKAKEFEELAEGIELMVATDRIIANPAGSTNQFVVINLGLKLKAKKDANKKKLEEEIANEMMPEIRDEVNKTLWKYTMEEFKRPELKDSLPEILKERLKEIFLEKKVLLQKVLIKEFLTQ